MWGMWLFRFYQARNIRFNFGFNIKQWSEFVFYRWHSWYPDSHKYVVLKGIRNLRAWLESSGYSVRVWSQNENKLVLWNFNWQPPSLMRSIKDSFAITSSGTSNVNVKGLRIHLWEVKSSVKYFAYHSYIDFRCCWMSFI